MAFVSPTPFGNLRFPASSRELDFFYFGADRWDILLDRLRGGFTLYTGNVEEKITLPRYRVIVFFQFI